MGSGAAAFAFCVISAAQVVFTDSAGCAPFNRRELMAAAAAAKTASERIWNAGRAPLAVAAFISVFCPFRLQLLDELKSDFINDRRMVVCKTVLAGFRNTFVFSVYRASGTFMQTEGSGIKVVVQNVFDHTGRPFRGNRPVCVAALRQFLFPADGRRGGDVLSRKISRDFLIAHTFHIQIVDQADAVRFSFNDRQCAGFIPFVSKRGLCRQRAVFLPCMKCMAYFFARILDIAFVKPCSNADRIIRRCLVIVAVVYNNQMFALFFKFVKEEQYFGVVPAQSRKVFDKDGVNIV